MAALERRCSMVAIVAVKGAGADTPVLLRQRAGEYLRGVWSYAARHIETNESALTSVSAGRGFDSLPYELRVLRLLKLTNFRRIRLAGSPRSFDHHRTRREWKPAQRQRRKRSRRAAFRW